MDLGKVHFLRPMTVKCAKHGKYCPTEMKKKKHVIVHWLFIVHCVGF